MDLGLLGYIYFFVIFLLIIHFEAEDAVRQSAETPKRMAKVKVS